MRKHLLLAAATMSILASCAKDEMMWNDGNITITASFEQGATDTRIALDNYNTLTWTEGDAFALIGKNEYSKFTLTPGEEGKTSATFTGAAVSDIMAAIFPHSSFTSLANDILNMKLSANLTASNCNLPMWASTISSDNISFKHLSGVLKIDYKGVPVGYDRIKVTASNPISGNFYAEIDEDIPALSSTSTNDADKSVTIEFTPATAADNNRTVYIPIPVGTYTSITIEAGTVNEMENVKTLTSTQAVERATVYTISIVNTGITGSTSDVVSTAEGLTQAIADGGSITLNGNITSEAPITVPAGISVGLDLNGNELSAPITLGEGAVLNLMNTAAPQTKSGNTGGLSGITSKSDIITAAKGAKIIIGENVSLHSTENCCIFVPTGAEDVEIISAGNLLSDGEYATIYVSGNITGGSGKITINGGSVKHSSDVPMYIAGKTDVTINGGTIEGTTAIEMRAGNLIVNGGEFIATGNPFNADANGNGSTTVGSAIAVCQHSTDLALLATINNGTFKGVKALYEEDLENTNATEKISLKVNGGTFDGQIYSENCKGFISGGTFNDPNTMSYLGTDANVTVNLKEDYTGAGFMTSSGQTIVLNLNNHTYDVTEPLVGSKGTQSQAFNFEKGSNVTIKDGTLKSSVARMFMQNYSNLTLESVTLNPTIPDEMTTTTYYVLSNNSGNVNLNGTTTITAPTKDGYKSFAFDVCKYSTYTEPKVTWNSTGKVTGSIELSGGEFIVAKKLVLTQPVKVVAAAKMTLNADVTPASEWNAGDALVIVNRKGELTIDGTGSIDAGSYEKVYTAVKMTESGENDATNPAKLTVNGATLKGYYYGISGNGNRHNTQITVNSGTITSNCTNDGHAIYHPQNGTLTINGGSLTGYYSAIEHRAGTLNITGGEFKALHTPTAAEMNGNGTSIKGAAIGVSKHKDVTTLNLNITGGTFTGATALHEEYTFDGTFNTDNPTFSVNGGIFNGKIYSENFTKFIHSGTFSDPTACYYMANNANITVNMKADYTGGGFNVEDGQKVTLDLGGYTYNATNPLVGSQGTVTQAFRVLTNSSFTVSNGTITSSVAKMLINNYGSLDLTDVTLAPSVPEDMKNQAYYVLSNNNGTTNINAGTVITTPTELGSNCPKAYAFDVCKYGTYPSLTVNVNGGEITGDIEYSSDNGDTHKLNISGGTINGDLVVSENNKTAAQTGVQITGGTQTGKGWPQQN